MRRRLFQCEVVAALAAGWILVFCLPFRRSSAMLGAVGGVSPGQGSLSTEQVRRARVVSAAIERLSRRMPWNCTCFVKAVAGRLMLARRGLRSAIRFGVAMEEGRLQAHAWLLAGGLTLLGGDRSQTDYAPIADIG